RNGSRHGARLAVQPLFSVGGLRTVTARDVVFDNVLELFGDAVALEGNRALAIDEHRRCGNLAGTRQADADFGMPALAGTVDHAAHDRDVHGVDAGIARTPHRHLAPQVRLDAVGEFLEEGAAGAAASRAGDHHGRERAQVHGLQDFLGHDDLAGAVAAGLGREGNPDGVAYALLQQHGERRRGSDDALAAHAGFGEPEMQGIVAAGGQVTIHGDKILHVADLARQDDGVAAQPEFFGAPCIADGRHYQGVAHYRLRFPGLRALAVLVHFARHEFVVEAAPVDADAHRLVVPAGDFDHLREVIVAPLAAAHVARIDAVLGKRLGAIGKLREQL